MPCEPLPLPKWKSWIETGGGGAFDEAIVQDRNEGMAAMEAGTYLAAALTIARLA